MRARKTFNGVVITGKPVEIEEATLELFSGKVKYEYFVDSNCKNKTTPANSEALTVGGAPVLAGTYYVRATAYDDPYFEDLVSEVVSLTINDLGALASETVMIGDSDNDAIGADGAGTLFIGVTYGFGFKKSEDVEAFPNIGIADGCEDIYTIIER